MGTLKTLSASMRRKAEQLPELGNRLAKKGGEGILREWLQVMPVDTSEAISNTRVGVGSAPVGTLRAFFLGSKGSTKAASAEKALEEGLAEIATKKPGQALFVSNTAQHIGDLDRGTSAQFAGGFVPRGLIACRVAIETARRKLWQ